MNNYIKSMMSREELEELLFDKSSPLEINKIISGYEISDNAFLDIFFFDGTPYFYHLSRVARIIISELNIIEPDIIIAALLHDYSQIENIISKEILEFNFGPYLVFLVELLSMPIEEASIISNNFAFDDPENIKIPFDDYLIIKLAEQVDYFRAFTFDLNYNPVSTLCELNKQMIPIAATSKNESVIKLLNELKQLKNKIMG